MKLTINLATRRYVNLRRLNAWLFGCMLLLGGLLLFQVREAAYNQAELSRIKEQSAASAKRSTAAPVSQAQLKALSTKIRFANGLIEKKSVNWLKMLDYLEEVVPSGVALSQIEPNQREQLLKLAGVARTFADLRTLVENMEQSKNFSDVYLLSQSEAKVGLTQQGLQFTVSCKVTQP
jgi:type IV pilus assembly protein PilN